MVDTNSNPEGIDQIIPGNDDAIRSIRLITKVISDACARGLASSKGGAINIQSDDDAPAVKIKKASVTSGKALNLVREAELSETEEVLSIDQEESSDETNDNSIDQNDESLDQSIEVTSSDLNESDGQDEGPREEK